MKPLFFCTLVLSAVLPILTGCRLTGPETISLEVDPDAPVLLQGDLAPFFDRIDRQCDRRSAQRILQSPEGQLPMPQLTLLHGMRMLLDSISDDRHIPFIAASAPLPPFGPDPFYRNELVLIRPAGDCSGLLWQITGTGDRDLTPDLRAVPANALLAADFSLDTRSVAAVLTHLLPLLTGIPVAAERLTTIADAVSGNYGVLALPLDDRKIGLMVAIPDRNAAFYDLLAATLPVDENGDLRIPRDGGGFRHSDDTTFFYNHPEVEAACAADHPCLPDDPAMRPIFADMPLTGSGFFYLSPDMPLPEEWCTLPQPTFIRLATDQTGIRADICAAWNWLDLLAVPLLPESLSAPGDTAIIDRLKQHQAAWNSALETADCRKQLRRLAQALQDYRTQHGTFPVPAGVPGLQLLVRQGLPPAHLICPAATADIPAVHDTITADNCSYIYFGEPGVSDRQTLPILMDWPKNHPGRFGVLFGNGDIRFFTLPPPYSARRAVSLLQSRFRYPEAEFRRLLRIADDLDRRHL